MARFFRDNEGDPAALAGKVVAVLGYGSQGRAQALNLRDSGVTVVVAQRPGSPNHERAVADGFAPVSIAEAAREGDVLAVMLPESVQPAAYADAILPHLAPGKALVFAHGFNIHYGVLSPPEETDVLLVAPKAIGDQVRRLYESGGGPVCLLGIAQDASGHAMDTGLAYARGIGASRAAILETTFAEETETDLFGEQVVLCGGLTELITAAFETLVAAGYQPEVAYFECLHEVKLIADLVYARGIAGMRAKISDTARYGDLTRGRRVIDDAVREEMGRILGEIRDGSFAREWLDEQARGCLNLKALDAQRKDHLLERAGSELRKRMPWIGEK